MRTVAFIVALPHALLSPDTCSSEQQRIALPLVRWPREMPEKEETEAERKRGKETANALGKPRHHPRTRTSPGVLTEARGL